VYRGQCIGFALENEGVGEQSAGENTHPTGRRLTGGWRKLHNENLHNTLCQILYGWSAQGGRCATDVERVI
jgi:hypothetical protein